MIELTNKRIVAVYGKIETVNGKRRLVDRIERDVIAFSDDGEPHVLYGDSLTLASSVPGFHSLNEDSYSDVYKWLPAGPGWKLVTGGVEADGTPWWIQNDIVAWKIRGSTLIPAIAGFDGNPADVSSEDSYGDEYPGENHIAVFSPANPAPDDESIRAMVIKKFTKEQST